MHNIVVVAILIHPILGLLADKTMSAHFVKKLLSVGGESILRQPRSICVSRARKMPANLTDCNYLSSYSVSNICYLRHLFPEEAFADKNLEV